MYTSYIGKKFLDYYKDEYNKPSNYTAEQFFDEVMYPLFFDHNKHLMSVKGSPFFQMNATDGTRRKKHITSKSEEIYVSVKEDPIFRLETKNKLKEKIQKKELAVHTFVGYGEMTPDAYTSGQLTNINYYFESEDYYSSWIGHALSLGSSGFSILIDDKTVLLQIFKGWKNYRLFINQTEELKENQITYWNSNWFTLTFNNDFDENFNFNNIKVDCSSEEFAIKVINWVELLFILCKNKNKSEILTYIYIIGDKFNTSVGFVNIFLHEIREMYEFRDKYFIEEKSSTLSDDQISKLLPFYKFKEACQMGTIGLKSIEPNGLRQYIPKGLFNNSKVKDLSIEKENNYSIYKLWIMAMLNKKELLDLSREFAKILQNVSKIQQIDDRGKTKSSQFAKELFESTTSKLFVTKVTDLIEDDNADVLRKLVEEVVLMPRDNFPLFITLIKFEYTILSKKEN